MLIKNLAFDYFKADQFAFAKRGLMQFSSTSIFSFPPRVTDKAFCTSESLNINQPNNQKDNSFGININLQVNQTVNT